MMILVPFFVSHQWTLLCYFLIILPRCLTQPRNPVLDSSLTSPTCQGCSPGKTERWEVRGEGRNNENIYQGQSSLPTPERRPRECRPPPRSPEEGGAPGGAGVRALVISGPAFSLSQLCSAQHRLTHCPLCSGHRDGTELQTKFLETETGYHRSITSAQLGASHPATTPVACQWQLPS